MDSILIAILGLALLIVVHEGGHFLVARLCGMRVERFSIGFGKPLVSFKRGDTIYQIAPIPLGGFVQITGLNPHEEFDKKDPYVYPNRPRWMRLAVLVAGPGRQLRGGRVAWPWPCSSASARRIATNDVAEVVPEHAGRGRRSEARATAAGGQRPGADGRSARSPTWSQASRAASRWC